jgi:hypothetical protein
MFTEELLSNGNHGQWSPELIERMKEHDVGINFKEGAVYAREK